MVMWLARTKVIESIAPVYDHVSGGRLLMPWERTLGTQPPQNPSKDLPLRTKRALGCAKGLLPQFA